MRRLFVCLAFFTTPLIYSNAQKFIGVRGGLSIPNLYATTDDEISRDYESVLQKNAGFLYEGPLVKENNKWAIMVELDYLGVGGIRKGMQPVVTDGPEIQALYGQLTMAKVYRGGYLYADYENTSVFNYLSIPILLKRYFGNEGGIRFYLETGLSTNILLTATNTTRNTTGNTSQLYYNNIPLSTVANGVPYSLAFNFEQSKDIKSDIQPMSFSAIAGAGLIFPVNKNHFFVDGRFDYGLLVLQRDRRNGLSHPAAGIISVGYAIAL